ncbi:bcl-2/adenovirus E1B 19 kDa-interacting protein 2-like protein isoform X2 [Gouania willdenowi]|uniref:bcl-2/adenovirus E1B 19 kDa-interacting protein 2-like protein isoform X2 n=1 Tax=Gouania willdenowi TaxID=441366 RepID=UPI00105561B5|nr:bcl-2/adenovirus E1B 19 kDa-interacting protein 2-like protein isoform X2 [Gouania willdenowi]
MELKEEPKDDNFPRSLQQDGDAAQDSQITAGDAEAPPTDLALSSATEGGAKKRLVAPSLSVTLSEQLTDSFSAAALSSTTDEGLSLDINLETMDTPTDSETDTPDCNELEWEDELPTVGSLSVGEAPCEELIEQDQVDSRGRRWRTFCISGHTFTVDMSVLEPYLQVLSHGGYYGDGTNAIILFTSCYLPENTVEGYDYIMDNLFRYIVGTLDLMVSENYLLVYLCAMAPRNKVPSIKWLRQCYTSIDRRLKKDLKGLLVVHPAWYIRAVITVVRPFISEKFSRKLRFVHSLQQLSQLIPTEALQIPENVRQFDQSLNR